MPTDPKDLSHVRRVFSCTRGTRNARVCKWCTAPAKLLCDRPIEEISDVAFPEGTTCSAPFCDRHGTFLSASKHLCIDCAKSLGKWHE